MEVSSHEITILPGGDPTLSGDSHAARMTNHLANHVFRRLVLEAELLRTLVVLPADWPLGDIVGPLVWSYRRRCLAVLWIQSANATRYPSSRTGIPGGPLLPR